MVEGAFGGFCFLGRGLELFVLVASSGSFFHITRSMGGVALLSGLYVPSIRGAPPPARSFDVVPGCIVSTDSMPFFLLVVSFSFGDSLLSLGCDLFGADLVWSWLGWAGLGVSGTWGGWWILGGEWMVLRDREWERER